MKVTRRKLALALAGSGAAKALAQATPPQNPPDELEAARQRVKANGALLAHYEVPMATEPAFQFKA